MTMGVRWLVALMALVPVQARADRPAVAVLAGTGLRNVWLGASEDQAPAVVTTIAARINAQVAIGMHGAFSYQDGSRSSSGNSSSSAQQWNILPTDLALALQYEEGRIAVAPWVGGHFSRYRFDETDCYGMSPPPRCSNTHVLQWTADFVSYGLTASYDISPPCVTRRLALFLDVQNGNGRFPCGADASSCRYSAATIGLAFRQ